MSRKFSYGAELNWGGYGNVPLIITCRRNRAKDISMQTQN